MLSRIAHRSLLIILLSLHLTSSLYPLISIAQPFGFFILHNSRSSVLVGVHGLLLRSCIFIRILYDYCTIRLPVSYRCACLWKSFFARRRMPMSIQKWRVPRGGRSILIETQGKCSDTQEPRGEHVGEDFLVFVCKLKGPGQLATKPCSMLPRDHWR